MKHRWKKWINEFEIEIDSAPEPTDIIWENRHFTSSQRNKKLVLVILAMILMLTISFVIIFICSATSKELVSIYPPKDCSGIPDTQTAQEALRTMAISEYEANTRMADEGKDVQYSGYV